MHLKEQDLKCVTYVYLMNTGLAYWNFSDPVASSHSHTDGTASGVI